MGAELIPAMAGGSGMETTAECDVTLVLPGDVEGLRPRLMAALERLGYHVLSEQPLHAKRGGDNKWSAIWSGNVLKYPISLLVGFKPSGERTTQVTFSYTVRHGGTAMITKGDMQTLAREAEAIAALAMHQTRSTTCTACGTESVRDSRFCRRCGAPLVIPEPVELEVLRLTAEARSAHQTIIAGAIMLAVMVLCLVPLGFDIPAKAATALSLFAGASGIPGWITMLFGMHRLHRTLNPKHKQELTPMARQRIAEAPQTTALPPQYTPMSVTETTTELLQPAEDAPPLQSPDRRETA